MLTEGGEIMANLNNIIYNTMNRHRRDRRITNEFITLITNGGYITGIPVITKADWNEFAQLVNASNAADIDIYMSMIDTYSKNPTSTTFLNDYIFLRNVTWLSGSSTVSLNATVVSANDIVGFSLGTLQTSI